MIVENEFLSKIKDFGLNSYEAKLWTALLSRGIATAGELSDIIAEFDMLGIIQAKVISKGRYGRTREIQLNQNTELNLKVFKTLKEALEL